MSNALEGISPGGEKILKIGCTLQEFASQLEAPVLIFFPSNVEKLIGSHANYMEQGGQLSCTGHSIHLDKSWVFIQVTIHLQGSACSAHRQAHIRLQALLHHLPVVEQPHSLCFPLHCLIFLPFFSVFPFFYTSGFGQCPSAVIRKMPHQVPGFGMNVFFHSVELGRNLPYNLCFIKPELKEVWYIN